MDYAFYRAIVMAVYKFKTLEEYNTKATEQDSTPLKQFLKKKRASPPFQLPIKKEMVRKYHRSVDVMFLQ